MTSSVWRWPGVLLLFDVTAASVGAGVCLLFHRKLALLEALSERTVLCLGAVSSAYAFFGASLIIHRPWRRAVRWLALLNALWAALCGLLALVVDVRWAALHFGLEAVGAGLLATLEWRFLVRR